MHGEFSQYNMMFSAQEKRVARRHIDEVSGKLKQLTPAGRRLLSLLLDAYNLNDGASLNRKQVARILGRPTAGLTPHDRNLLKRLCDLGLLDGAREVLRTKDNYACGAEYRYSMNEDIGWILNRMRNNARRSRRKKTA